VALIPTVIMTAVRIRINFISLRLLSATGHAGQAIPGIVTHGWLVSGQLPVRKQPAGRDMCHIPA